MTNHSHKTKTPQRTTNVTTTLVTNKAGEKVPAGWIVRLVDSEGRAQTTIHTTPASATAAVAAYVRSTPWAREHNKVTQPDDALIEGYYSAPPAGESYAIVPAPILDNGLDTWSVTVDANSALGLAGTTKYDHPYVAQFLNETDATTINALLAQAEMFHAPLRGAISDLMERVLTQYLRENGFGMDGWGRGWEPRMNLGFYAAEAPAGAPHQVSPSHIEAFVNRHAADVATTRQWAILRQVTGRDLKDAITDLSQAQFDTAEQVILAVLDNIFAKAGDRNPWSGRANTGAAA